MNTTPREIEPTFPEGATDGEKVAITLMYPRQFVMWCRMQVGKAPDAIGRYADGCVIEEYLASVTGAKNAVGIDYIHVEKGDYRSIIAPTWVRRVVQFVDRDNTRATYNDVANMLMLALERNELA